MTVFNINSLGIKKLDFMYAKLTAKDGISFYTVSRSEMINSGLRAKGLETYSYHNSISKAVRECAEKWKANVKTSLEEKLLRGDRFTAIMDEHTSKAHYRYMDLELYG